MSAIDHQNINVLNTLLKEGADVNYHDEIRPYIQFYYQDPYKIKSLNIALKNAIEKGIYF